jgi:protease I
MVKRLEHARIAVLATDGFEESELKEPVKALKDEGAEITIVSPKAGSIKGWKLKDWGGSVDVDATLDQALSGDFEALLLPGGVINPDRLRLEPKAALFVRGFAEEMKPIAAICHGPWMLIEADLVRGKRIAAWPSLRTDLINAGAQWVDEPVVEDGNLITSRKPDDIPAFVERFCAVLERTLAPQGS